MRTTPRRRGLAVAPPLLLSSPGSGQEVKDSGSAEREISFITLPPPSPDRRSSRPNPLPKRRLRIKAGSTDSAAGERRKRIRIAIPSSPSSPKSLAELSFRPLALPDSPSSSDTPASAGRGPGIPIPEDILTHADFARALVELRNEYPLAVIDGTLTVPVQEAVIDAMWEACTFLRDTEPRLKSLATTLLRHVLNAACT